MSDIFKIMAVFFVILLLLRKKMPVGYVMAVAAVILAVMYRMELDGILPVIKKASTSEVTIKLWISLSLIRIFELILREKNVLSTMMSSVKTSFRSRKAVIISMPLLIGMLPSLGGAYFSAPMVKEATSGLDMSREEKAFINYWFRHPWEYILPLYPGILLAAAISGIAIYGIIAANMICASVLILTGFIYSMREIRSRPEAGPPDEKIADTKGRSKTREVLSFLPVILVLLLVVILRVELHYALLIMIIPLFFIFRYQAGDFIRVIRHGFALDIVILILGIMLFKETMEASGAVRNLSRVFLENGIPVLPILCLLPFMTGLLTGLTVGFVGSTFPLIISMAGGASVPAVSMAFAAGFIGVLLSPVHLCLILTKEYFKADLWGVYRKMIPASVFIFLAALVQYMLIR